MMTLLFDWWNTWQFAYPAWFWALLLWPFLSQFKPQANATSNNTSVVFRHPRLAAFIQASPIQPGLVVDKTWPIWLSRLLSLLVLLSLLSALAQPQRQLEHIPLQNTPPQRDIALVLESSVSFVLADYKLQDQPASRMDVVKAVLDQFIAGLSANRFSLALYAEQAYTLMPMTADSQALRMNLQRLQPYLAGRTDEAMGEALGLALRDLTANAQDSVQKRLVVLVSDGLQKSSRIALEDIVAYAQKLAVPIYTIGIGAGSEQADQRLYSGLIYQPLESQSLRFLAEQTGGRYFRVGGRDDLSAVLREIETSEGVITQTVQQTRWRVEALYHWPLTASLLLFGLWWLWTSGGRRWNS